MDHFDQFHDIDAVENPVDKTKPEGAPEIDPAFKLFKKEQADREERRRIMEQEHTLDYLTKVLMKIDITNGKKTHENVLTFKQASQLDEFDPDQTEIRQLQQEYEIATRSFEELQRDVTVLRERLRQLDPEDEDGNDDEDSPERVS